MSLISNSPQLSQIPLAEIAAAQATTTIFAFDRAADARRLARLQTIYAAKLALLEAFYRLFDESTPDIVLRAADGREVVLRIPEQEVGELYAALRESQDTSLRKLEAEIVQAHIQQREEEQVRQEQADKGAPDYVPAILALCAASEPASAVLPNPQGLPTAPPNQQLPHHYTDEELAQRLGERATPGVIRALHGLVSGIAIDEVNWDFVLDKAVKLDQERQERLSRFAA